MENKKIMKLSIGVISIIFIFGTMLLYNQNKNMKSEENNENEINTALPENSQEETSIGIIYDDSYSQEIEKLYKDYIIENEIEDVECDYAITNEEMKMVIEDENYEIKDVKLKKVYNEIVNEKLISNDSYYHCVLLNESADTIEKFLKNINAI